MMKKLLILMLVLGMTSSASALLSDFSLEADATTLYVIGVAGGSVATYSIMSGALILIDDPQAAGYPILNTDVLNGGLNTYIAGDMAACYSGGPPGPPTTYLVINAGVSPATGDSVDAGTWFEGSMVLTGSYTVGQVIESLTVYDDQLVVLGTKDVTYIPEPMTIALLGLGGLFLVRRRR